MASPSGAPYGNHDCRNGIAAQTTERGHGKERPVPGRGHPHRLHVHHMVVCSVGSRSLGGATVPGPGLGIASAGRGISVQSHAGSQGTVYREHEGVPQSGGRPHRRPDIMYP